MPTHSVPRLMMSSRREGCWACTGPGAAAKMVVRRTKIRRITGIAIPFAKTARRIASANVRQQCQSGVAAVAAQHVGDGAAPRHFVAQVLEPPPRVGLPLVNHLDRGLAAHRAGGYGG